MEVEEKRDYKISSLTKIEEQKLSNCAGASFLILAICEHKDGLLDGVSETFIIRVKIVI